MPEIKCKLCGVEIQGRAKNDFDVSSRHAIDYHLDLVDQYGEKLVRNLVDYGHVEVTRDLTAAQLAVIDQWENAECWVPQLLNKPKVVVEIKNIKEEKP